VSIAELARAELRDHFRRPLNRYPEIRPTTLAKTLGAYFACEPSRLLVTRGTSEAIDLLIRAFCREGQDSILTAAPTFSMYGHYATVQGAAQRTVATAPGKNFEIDADAILEACDEQTKLIFLCSPNNPTGTLVSRPALIDILERRGNRSAIVVDEAYIEFSGEPSAVELLDRYPNLVVLRTLSKALAFAGARCGTVMGPVEVIRILNAIQAPYAMSTPVVECVEDALGSSAIEEARGRIAEIVAERERLMSAMSSFRFVETIWPSAANFFLVRVDNGDAVVRQTRDNGILLRDFGGSLENCIRVTIGSKAENDRLLTLFAELDRGES
jgi:histidinol-phosphate aminotransferase